MQMTLKGLMRRKQRGNEQRWVASRKSLAHIITLDYTLQWRLDAVKCLQSRKEPFKRKHLISNFHSLIWPYPSKDILQSDKGHACMTFLNCRAPREPTTSSNTAAKGAPKWSTEDFCGNLLSKIILPPPLLPPVDAGEVCPFKGFHHFLPSAPALKCIKDEPKSIISKGERAIFVRFYGIYLERRSLERERQLKKTNTINFSLLDSLWVKTEDKQKRKEDDIQQRLRLDLYPGHCC